MTLTYEIDDAMYINITNKCPNNCTFCIRHTGAMDDYDLWLDEDPEAGDIIDEIDECGGIGKYREVVFCGFGEPLARPDVVAEVARCLKKRRPEVRLRVNTNGLAKLITGRDVLPELAGLIDVMSISLNAQDAEEYDRLCNSEYGQQAYNAMLDFARESKKCIPKVVLTVVKVPGVDVEACSRTAAEMGVEFRAREQQ
ncbi:MAG: TatD family nuclease-associated radical SAM protein [Clostridia bacterium]|nr:TatD family nuclease-associated radical SAM protein [Clostridia bacterium]